MSVARLLGTSTTSFRLSPDLWGFGGVQGGLALALLTAAMQRQAGGRVLRRVSAQFQRPLRDEFDIEVEDDGSGKNVSWRSARARAKGVVSVAANGVFSVPGREGMPIVAPPRPAVPPPDDCPPFVIPPEFVPFAQKTEIRIAGAARPFTGAPEAELTAWLRLVEDDVPPDDGRLIVLMDSLPPAYSVMLTELVPIPTVTFTVTPAAGLARASSPWVLFRARAGAVNADGWQFEHTDAWGPDGTYLGRGEQLRLVMAT